MSDDNNANASEGQPAPAPASDLANLVIITFTLFVAAADVAAGALSDLYGIIERVRSFVAAEQADMDVVHQEIWGILQRVNTPFDRLAANVQEDLRRALREASVLGGVRRFAPTLRITERPGLDDSVTVQVGLIPGWDTPVQSERPPFSRADWARIEAHVRRRDRARQWRRYNRWISEDGIAEEEHAEEIAELNARQWRRRIQSDQGRLTEEENAEDAAELNEMYLGQQVQITRAGRSQLRQLGYPVRSDGAIRVRRLDDDE
ncbi:hypothetical protein D0860_01369 [Hortaea werneckii]|uniref:Uncharacterized protein n=1 Tax=Hortaea werneckii TaxID=91943 RepID=A0A3M7HS08_HORWE|nr:hypothetical protein D0860_01369 [Hortaea werneckii]